MKNAEQIGDKIPLDLSDFTREFLHEQALKWERRAWDARALLERAEDFVKDCKHNGENANAAEWLADFVKFQEQTLDNWLSHAKSRLEHNWAVTCVSPSDIIALIEELKELREFEAEMALRSRTK